MGLNQTEGAVINLYSGIDEDGELLDTSGNPLTEDRVIKTASNYWSSIADTICSSSSAEDFRDRSQQMDLAVQTLITLAGKEFKSRSSRTKPSEWPGTGRWDKGPYEKTRASLDNDKYIPPWWITRGLTSLPTEEELQSMRSALLCPTKPPTIKPPAEPAKPGKQSWRETPINEPGLIMSPQLGFTSSPGEIGIPPWTSPKPTSSTSLIPAFLIGGAVAAIVVVILKWKGNSKRRSK